MIPRNIKAYRNSVVGIKLAFLGHEITQPESDRVPDKSHGRTLMFSSLSLGLGERNLDSNPQAAVF